MANKNTGIEEESRPPAVVTTAGGQAYPGPVRRQVRGTALARLLRTTDAKQIGLMYFVTSFGFFVIGGVMALLMRGELGRPGLQFLSPEQYNQLLTMHGTVMLLLFARPAGQGALLDHVHRFPHDLLVQHWLGAEGMARRYADYLPSDSFTLLNTVSTIGSFILGCSTVFFIWNIWKSYRYGRLVTVDDPWGFGNSLEWATSCPPPLRNFDRLPRIRSERPAFDLKYGTRTADLGRDLRQGDVRAPQRPVDELRPDQGPHHSDEVVSSSGARDIEVPSPEDVHRSDRPAGAVGGDPLGSDEGDRPTDPRWRTGGREDSDG